MSDTPRTDARERKILIENEDSCCAIYVTIDGLEFAGNLVDSDFARELERENARLREILKWINLSSSANQIDRSTESQIEAKAKEAK